MHKGLPEKGQVGWTFNVANHQTRTKTTYPRLGLGQPKLTTVPPCAGQGINLVAGPVKFERGRAVRNDSAE